MWEIVSCLFHWCQINFVHHLVNYPFVLRQGYDGFLYFCKSKQFGSKKEEAQRDKDVLGLVAPFFDMASEDTTNLSELCVCLGVALIGAGEVELDEDDIMDFVEDNCSTIGDLYDLADDYHVDLTLRDIKYRDRNYDKSLRSKAESYRRMRDRYFLTSVLIAETIYGGKPPYPEPGTYQIAGGENRRLEDGDPSDFIIDGEGFSLKDDSPGLFGGTTKHLVSFLSPEIIEQLTDAEKARSGGKKFMQGQRIFSKDGKSLRNNVSYDWHLAAEEKYSNKAYELCLQALLNYFIRIRKQISLNHGYQGFMLYNPDLPDSEIPDIYFEPMDYFDLPSEFTIWAWDEDVANGVRRGNRIPSDKRRWLAYFNSEKFPETEHFVIFDAYWVADYTPYQDEYGNWRCEAYDEEAVPMTYLGVFRGDWKDIDSVQQLVLPLCSWYDENDVESVDSEGFQISVQGVMANNRYSASYSEYDADADIEAILYSPSVDTELYWREDGSTTRLDSGIRHVLHHFADYGNDSGIWGVPKVDGPKHTADYWMRYNHANWVDHHYDQEVAKYFQDREMTEYAFWLECVFFNSSRKFADELNAKVGDIGKMSEEEELWFLRFLFRIYQNSYYYVNMHSKHTDILRVPSLAELVEKDVHIRDAHIPPEAITVALRFFVENHANDECEINISIVGGSGSALFQAPTCKISYRNNRRTAGLYTVYEPIAGQSEPPESPEQNLDDEMGI